MKSILAFQIIGVSDSQSGSERVKRDTNIYSNGQLIDTSFYGPVTIRN